MRFGYFDDEHREYVITRPDTPLPWINYLGVDEYCGLISNTAGGYSFYKDARERRILRYRYNNVPTDRPGRYIYIRDNENGDYWSASWQPVLKDLTKYSYECRHGLSYTTISSEYAKIRTGTTYFVPIGENLEIWRLKIVNASKKQRTLGLFTYVEFCMWDAVNDMTDFQYNFNIGQTRFAGNTIYHVTNYHAHQPCYSWFWSSRRVASFDGQREPFIGPYRSESNPIAVERGKCSRTLAVGWAPFAGLHVNLSLEPGGTEEVVFILGYGEKWGEEEKYISKYKNGNNVESELRKLKNYWDESLNKYSAVTPDTAVNSMVNIWNQYQCRTTFNWSRSASYYESGIGRGMGFRDSNQDTLGFVHQIPHKVRQRLMDIASTQFPEGRANHQYSPLTKKGNGEGFGDDHLWLILAVAGYLKETGDLAFLEEKVPFNDGSPGTIYDHLKRALDYSWKNTGWQDLPKIEKADWNDCLNLTGPNGKSVSVMIAEMFVMTARLMGELADRSGRAPEAGGYRDRAEEMKKRINAACWDGAWYHRAIDDSGAPLGTQASEEGKIWLESQTWAVLSGTADGERATACMDSVARHLATKNGIVLFWPAYSVFHPEYGYVSVFPKGLKENAAIFCHTNPWAMIAETMLGRGDEAFRYYKAILPYAGNDRADIRWTEPYVYSQMIAGKEHKDFGQAKNSWLTGTASWNFVAVSQHILGVRPDYDGLIIDPCIPASWKGFAVKRVFRGATYRISVKNGNKANSGVTKMTVDGREIRGNKAPVFQDDREHIIEVVLGG
jgi:cellobiose phosphorylase